MSKLQPLPKYTPPPMFQMAPGAIVADWQTCSLPLSPVYAVGIVEAIATVLAASWNCPVKPDTSFKSTFSVVPPDVLNMPSPVSASKVEVAPFVPVLQ